MKQDHRASGVEERFRERVAGYRNAREAAWAKRGQGWMHWGHPVPLEPPYASPKEGPQGTPAHDGPTARQPVRGLVQMVAGSARRAIAGTIREVGNAPQFVSDSQPLVEMQTSLGPDTSVSPELSEQFLRSASHGSHPLAFEIVGTREAIRVLFTCRAPDRDLVTQQLRAHVPDVVVEESDGLLARLWGKPGQCKTALNEFGLAREYLFPLRTQRTSDADPLIGIVAALEDLRDREVGVLQILFHTTHSPWAQAIRHRTVEWQSRRATDDPVSASHLATKKLTSPLCAVVIRVAALAGGYQRATHIARALSGPLAALSNPGSNELQALPTERDMPWDHEEDLLRRQSRRSGMLLNVEELASLAHLPSPAVRSPKLTRDEGRTRPAPANARGHRLALGENVHAGQATLVTLNPEQRTRHVHLVGASGTGKSTLLLNMIRQDIEQSAGFAVLDPHGDLIDQILGCIPENRHADVVYFDPSDEQFPIGFNILSAHSELEKTLVSSDLVSVFRRFSTSWGDQMTAVLGNAIQAFLESSEGGTLADMRRFLVEKEFRASFLRTVRDEEVVYYWQKEFPLLTGRPQAPLLTRLDTFLRPKLIRHIVAQRDNRLDIAGIMDEGKILLVKLAQGTIGEENAFLLGSLLVSKFHQLAMSRQQVEESKRRPFYLYLDEFHHFITPSMGSILTGARKYRLGLILAHQGLDQLSQRDADVTAALLSNAYTRICFRVGESDARKLAEGFSYFTNKHLQNLSRGEAIGRTERAEYDFNLKTLPAAKVDDAVAVQRKEAIIALSRERYGTPRNAVEARLSHARLQSPSTEPLAPRSQEPALAPAEPIESAVAMAVPALTRDVVVVEKEAASRRAPKPSPASPPPLGRGGQQHKWLQELIKRSGEAFGYRATIEKPILDGKGSVDVALEKDGRSVACEISVTTTVDHEAGNVAKCLTAGFQHVLLVSTDSRKLNVVIERLQGRMSPNEFAKVHALSPETVYPFIESLEAETASREETVHGYKVKVNYQPLAEDEKKARKLAVTQVILQSLRRLRD